VGDPGKTGFGGLILGFLTYRRKDQFVMNRTVPALLTGVALRQEATGQLSGRNHGDDFALGDHGYARGEFFDPRPI
jgi:hypothetical protein